MNLKKEKPKLGQRKQPLNQVGCMMKKQHHEQHSEITTGLFSQT